MKPRPPVHRERRGTVVLNTRKRSVDIPVDGAGHLRRTARLVDSSIERSAAGGSLHFKGTAAVYNSRTWIGPKRWGFWEEIAPGAFDATLATSDVRFLKNHNPDWILGRNTAGTLTLASDAQGLQVESDMAPVSYAADLAISLERRDITQMSFAFDMAEYEWSELDDGTELLRHTVIDPLYDVAVVTYPAYTETEAELASMSLMAAARAVGFSALELDELGERLAHPDEELANDLRSLIRDDEDLAPEGADEEPAEHDSETPQAEHAGDPPDDGFDAMRDRRLAQLTQGHS